MMLSWNFPITRRIFKRYGETEMLKEQRRQEITELLYQKGYVEITELSQKYNVAEMTIRRDIDYLIEHNSSFSRKRGGAIFQADSSYEKRIMENPLVKQQIAAQAFSIIQPAEIVFLDSGTTNLQLAKLISKRSNNVVVTNSIENAYELLKNPDVKTFLIGGDLDCNVHSTRGIVSEEQMRSIQVDTAFLGANAIREDGRVCISNTIEIGFKKAVLSSSRRSYVLADSSKFGKQALLSYANAADLDGVITDRKINPQFVASMRQKGINIIISE